MNALDVLIADASQARFFRYTAPPADLALEASLACPAARRQEQDLDLPLQPAGVFVSAFAAEGLDLLFQLADFSVHLFDRWRSLRRRL